MKQKKAAIEIQFNWLFVLIIGAVILILFSSIIFKQKQASETSQNALLLRTIDSILTGSETTKGTINTLRIPNTRIDFRCNRYSIGTLSKQIDVMNVFTPSSVTGNKLITITKDWSLPYRITNVLYLTSPEYRYIFVGGDVAHALYKLMPNETFRQYDSANKEFEHKGETRTRFVYHDKTTSLNLNNKGVPQEFRKVEDGSVSALVIRGDLESGKILFYQKEGAQFKLTGDPNGYPYAKKETLFGAVLTDAPNVYACVMNNLFDKLRIVSSVYYEKAQQLQTSGEVRCRSLTTAYNTAALQTLRGITFDRAQIQQIVAAEQQLEIQNKEAQTQSCPTIY